MTTTPEYMYALPRELKMRKKRVKARRSSAKPIIFEQRFTDLFGDVMVVCSGASHKDVVAYAKKNKFRKDLLEYIEGEHELFEMAKTNDNGRFAYNTKVRGLFLVLLNYQDCWDFWEFLIHELNHAVFRFAQIKGMEEESEGQARLQEYLFRKIRRKLQGIEPL